ncbi:mitotic checkpoint protein-like protein BUB3 [Sporormia fimetaria CBS 119925]|uniref:Mitotic checkpoint protein-like protein BUB3 n=1 Tax=Sporormia fimetaria CBS 119925 TaxID=1340428 RepID=A0A6A6UXQ2_9PLEO|nr:mitotic checkpoint protein-like protein BUB3 [Sporormia fimetaria CBS 119925]
MNCCMPSQYVDFPDPGGPMTNCAKGMMADLVLKKVKRNDAADKGASSSAGHGTTFRRTAPNHRSDTRPFVSHRDLTSSATMSSQFELAQNPTDAISSVNFSPYTPTRLLVSSWDKNVYLYDTHSEPGGQLLQTFEHPAPVLDVCFGRSDDEAFSCGLDWEVRRIDLTSGEMTVLSTHDAGVRRVVFSKKHNLLVSGGWDATLHLHDLETPGEFAVVRVESKVFSLSVSATKLVVAMANRAVNIYELDALKKAAGRGGEAQVEPWQKRESSMKYMTRAVSCMPNDDGYASSSIEGRVAVEWFDPSEESQKRKYAFKCHRQAIEGQDVVYPVNALAFHPVYGSFASGGGDGVVSLWDGVNKRRIRQYQRFPASIASLAFSENGKHLAVGVSPGFEDGQEDMADGAIKVFIREISETEAQGKKK